MIYGFIIIEQRIEATLRSQLALIKQKMVGQVKSLTDNLRYAFVDEYFHLESLCVCM